MDTNTSVLQEQSSGSEPPRLRYLKRITEHNTTPERLKWIWEQLQKCDYAFDDFNRGQVDFFITLFTNPSNEFFELGDSGLVILVNPLIKGDVLLHYLVWDSSFDLHVDKGPVVELFDYLFYTKQIHHVTGFIASFNQKAIRQALTVGMKFEGEIRESFLWKGKYFNTSIYGILEKEYRVRRERLV